MARAILALVAVAIALLLSACGPTQATIRINEAEVAFEKATLNEAESLAPYEYTNAKEYLYKAKEEWGYSDFEISINYAELSKDFAERATTKAKGGEVDVDGAKVPDKPGATPDKPGGKKGPQDPSDADADELEKIR